MNSETDFVARNKRFQQLVTAISRAALTLPAASASINLLAQAPISVDNTVLSITGHLAAASGVLGEKLAVRRVCVLEAPQQGGVFYYVHNGTEAVVADGALLLFVCCCCCYYYCCFSGNIVLCGVRMHISCHCCSVCVLFSLTVCVGCRRCDANGPIECDAGSACAPVHSHSPLFAICWHLYLCLHFGVGVCISNSWSHLSLPIPCNFSYNIIYFVHA